MVEVVFKYYGDPGNVAIHGKMVYCLLHIKSNILYMCGCGELALVL
jgi:hypothetical protein